MHDFKTAKMAAENLNNEIAKLTDHFIKCGVAPDRIPIKIPVTNDMDAMALQIYEQIIQTVALQLQALVAECNTNPNRPATIMLSPSVSTKTQAEIIAESLDQHKKMLLDIPLIKKANNARLELLKKYEQLKMTPPHYLAGEIRIPSQQEIEEEDYSALEALNNTAKGSLIQFSRLHEELLKPKSKNIVSHFKEDEPLIISPSTPAECAEAIRRVNLKHDNVFDRLDKIGIPSKNIPKKLNIADYNLSDENEYARLKKDLGTLIQLLNTEFAPVIDKKSLQLTYPLSLVTSWLSLAVDQKVIDENAPVDDMICQILDARIKSTYGDSVKLIGTRPYVTIVNDQCHFIRYVTFQKEESLTTISIRIQKPKQEPVVQQPKPAPKRQSKRRVYVEETREIAAITTSSASFSSSVSNLEPIATIYDEYNTKLERAKIHVKATFFQIDLSRAETERNVNNAYLNVDNHLRLGDRAQYELAEDDNLFLTLQTQRSAIEKLESMTSNEEEISAAKNDLQKKLEAFKATCENIKAKLMTCDTKLTQIQAQIQAELIAAEKAAARTRSAINDDGDVSEDETINKAVNVISIDQPLIALPKKSDTLDTHSFLGKQLSNATNQPKKTKNKKKPQQTTTPKYINPLTLDLISSNVEKSLTTIDLLYDKYIKHCTDNNKQGVFDTTSAIAMIDLEGLVLSVCETIARFQQRAGLSIFEDANDANICRHVSKYCFHWFIFKAENVNNKQDYHMLDFIQFIRTDVKKALASLIHGKGEYKISATHPELVKTRKALTVQNATTPDIAVLNARFAALVSFMGTILQEHHKQAATSMQKHERVYALSFLLALVGLSVKNAMEINGDNEAYQLKTSYLQQLNSLADDEAKTLALLQRLTMVEVKKLLIEICNEKSHENKNTWINFTPLQNKLTQILTNFIVDKAEELRLDCFTVPESYVLSFSERAIALQDRIYQPYNQFLLNRINQDAIFQHIAHAINCISNESENMATQFLDFILAGNNMQNFKNKHLWDARSRQLFDEIENLLIEVSRNVNQSVFTLRR